MKRWTELPMTRLERNLPPINDDILGGKRLI